MKKFIVILITFVFILVLIPLGNAKDLNNKSNEEPRITEWVEYETREEYIQDLALDFGISYSEAESKLFGEKDTGNNMITDVGVDLSEFGCNRLYASSYKVVDIGGNEATSKIKYEVYNCLTGRQINNIQYAYSYKSGGFADYEQINVWMEPTSFPTVNVVNHEFHGQFKFRVAIGTEGQWLSQGWSIGGTYGYEFELVNNKFWYHTVQVY